MNISKLKGNPLYFNRKMIDDKGLELTISVVELRAFNTEQRVVLSFKDEERDMKLNPRQVMALSRAFGDEADKWVGEKVAIKRGEHSLEITPKAK